MWHLTGTIILLAAEGGDKPSLLEFTWEGFAFAIVNFLILVAILYKLLHKPLLRVLQQRQDDIRNARQEARDKADAADRTRHDYQQKLAGIDQQRDELLSEARHQADAAREELIAKARTEADREVANRRRDWDRQRRDALDALRDDIVDVSLQLARNVLRRLTDDEMEGRLHRQLEEALGKLIMEADDKARDDLFEGDAPARVISAKPLTDAQRTSISERIQTLADGAAKVDFDTDEDLVAGVRIEFSSTAIDATLADVLAVTRERFVELGSASDGDDAGETTS